MQRYKPGRAAQLMESVSRAFAQQLSLCLGDTVRFGVYILVVLSPVLFFLCVTSKELAAAGDDATDGLGGSATLGPPSDAHLAPLLSSDALRWWDTVACCLAVASCLFVSSQKYRTFSRSGTRLSVRAILLRTAAVRCIRSCRRAAQVPHADRTTPFNPSIWSLWRVICCLTCQLVSIRRKGQPYMQRARISCCCFRGCGQCLDRLLRFVWNMHKLDFLSLQLMLFVCGDGHRRHRHVWW